jgi:hypothetical protein
MDTSGCKNDSREKNFEPGEEVLKNWLTKTHTCSRGITPKPTNGVKVEVVTEELWTAMVRSVPMRILIYPFTLVALKMTRSEAPMSIFCKIQTNPMRAIQSMTRERKRTNPAES